MKCNVVIELKSNGWEIRVEGENKVIHKFILEDALEDLKIALKEIFFER